MANDMKKEKLIVFDMMGTLTTNPHLVSDILSRFLSKTDKKAIRSAYELYKIDKISNLEFWSRVDAKDRNIEKKMLKGIELRKETMSVLRTLKRDYRLAILSNVPKEWGHYLSKRFNFSKYFDEIVFSGDYGVKKPDPEIYELLLNKFRYLEESVYYIDDELNDLKTGNKYSMTTIWLKQEQKDSDYSPDFVIEDLAQVREIVGQRICNTGLMDTY